MKTSDWYVKRRIATEGYSLPEALFQMVEDYVEELEAMKEVDNAEYAILERALERVKDAHAILERALEKVRANRNTWVKDATIYWLLLNDKEAEVEQLKTELISTTRLWEEERNVSDQLEQQIEQLRAEVRHWKEARQSALDAGDLMKQEIERLLAELDALLKFDTGSSPNAPCWYSSDEAHAWECGWTDGAKAAIDAARKP